MSAMMPHFWREVYNLETILDSVSVTNELARLNPAYRKKAGIRVDESWL
jgi:hypothetical protein